MSKFNFWLPTLIGALSSAALPQTFSDIVPRDPTRSGLVRIYGSNLGDASTHKLFLSVATTDRNSSRKTRPVHIARWQTDLIEFYVPEEAETQSTQLYMRTPGGNINLGALNIRARDGATGRFRWRFQAADQYIITRPAIGLDGTVYVLGNYGHLYALRPDGGLKWIWSNGVDGTVDVGPNGTIYCAGGGGIQAFSPSGTRLWTFPLQSAILAGPNVGPDGNIYAADNSRWNPSPTGAVVLSPAGQEIWSGGVFYARGGTHQTEIHFDQNRAYLWSAADTPTGAIGGLRSILLGGGLDWVDGNIVGIQPAGLASGGVIAHGTSTTRRLATNGSLTWSFDLWSVGGYQPQGDVVAGSDESAFFRTTARLNALNSDGSLRFSNPISGIANNLALKSDNSLFLLQKSANFGQPFRIEAYSASNGSFLWASDNLPVEFGTTIAVWNRMKFSANGNTVYFGTAGPVTGPYTAHCYVYAMDAQ